MSVFKVSEVQLSYKHSPQRSVLPKITSAHDAYSILHNQWDENRIDLAEDFKILLLNRANQVLGLCHLSSGGVAGTTADPKLVFVAALKANASGIILAHNHPSGALKPSEADKKLTKKLEKGGELLEIAVLDHLIITNEGFHSIPQGMSWDTLDKDSFPAYVEIPVFEF